MRDGGSFFAMKCIFLIPFVFREDGQFWERDAGLLARGFAGLGYESELWTPAPEMAEKPLLPESFVARDATGWEQNAGAVEAKLEPQSTHLAVLFCWTLKRFEPLRDQLRKNGMVFAERMDTNGFRSSLLNPLEIYRGEFAARIPDGFRNPVARKIAACVAAAAVTIARILCAFWLEKRSAEIVSQIPVVLVESPLALSRIQRWLRFWGKRADGVHFVPHSVDVDRFSTGPKRDQLVVIGRWTAHQKNWPAVREVAIRFLKRHPHYELVVIGEHQPEMEKNIPGAVLQRIRFLGRQQPSRIAGILSESRIFFAASRWESFLLSAGEALCSGCSVVLPPGVPTAEWFCRADSGTFARSNKPACLVEALEAEAGKWARGERNPTAISMHWKSVLSPTKQAEEILSLCSKVAGTMSDFR